MGDRPGMNHDRRRCGQCPVGSPPERAHTSTCRTPDGGAWTNDAAVGSRVATASTIWKKSGAAASAPTNTGFPTPEKSPTQTASTYEPKTPTAHASRNPHEVPVFHATGIG